MELTEKRIRPGQGLAETAGGNLNGKDKVTLETYVQAAYFDRILRRANLRFMAMSQGQYELKRAAESDNRSAKSGLELNVTDHYNGSERSVKTLSGVKPLWLPFPGSWAFGRDTVLRRRDPPGYHVCG